MSFTIRFALVLAAGIVLAAVISPLVAVALARGGFHFPFPRIFDRTVMASLLLAILWNAREFKLRARLERGFGRVLPNLPRALRGFVVAMAAVGILWALGAILAARTAPATMPAISELPPRLPKYVLAAILIAIIEEGFFRAFLLDGMEDDFGERGALAASSAVYALAHLVRSPARFYLTALEPAAGARNLAASLAQLADPLLAPPALLGLFLIGLVLGAGFIITQSVYFSVGMHAGLIIGLKSWPAIMADRAPLPGWLFGYSRFPLVSGAAGWLIAIVILSLIRPLCVGLSGSERRDR